MARLIRFITAIWRAIQAFRSSMGQSSNGEDEANRLLKAQKAEKEIADETEEVGKIVEEAESDGSADAYADAWDKLRCRTGAGPAKPETNGNGEGKNHPS